MGAFDPWFCSMASSIDAEPPFKFFYPAPTETALKKTFA